MTRIVSGDDDAKQTLFEFRHEPQRLMLFLKALIEPKLLLSIKTLRKYTINTI